MAHFDPARPDFSPYGFTCVRWTPTAMPRGDRHNEVELNLLAGGRLVYLMGGTRVVVPDRRLTAFWAGISHQIVDFDGDPEYFVMTIPLAWFLQWSLPQHLTRPILEGEIVSERDEGRWASDWASFNSWCDDLDDGSEERRRICLLEVEARLRRLAIGIPAANPVPHGRPPASDPHGRRAGKAERMAGFIARNYTHPLDAQRVAQHVDLHPNYAMSLFQKTFGTTLIAHITQHRLSHAQRLLVTTDDTIANIAFGSGFGSLSRFNEAFRNAFGCTPRTYRRSHSPG